MKNDIKKITNLKTIESDNKKKNKLSEMRAWKRKLLSSTDWVTLPDVSKNIKNLEDVISWRDSVRNVKIERVSDIVSAEKELTYLGRTKVEPIKDNHSIKPLTMSKPQTSATKPCKMCEDNKKLILDLQNRISKMENVLQEKEYTILTHVESFKAAEKILVEELLKEYLTKYMKYSVVREKVEQATEYLSSNGQDNLTDYTLLINDGNASDEEYARAVINDGKELLQEYSEFLNKVDKELKYVYTMKCDELTDFFEEHGYRYRCTTKNRRNKNL